MVVKYGVSPNNNSIESVHLQFCKRLLSVKKITQNGFVCGELGRMPLINARYVSIIKFWLNILHSKPEKYIYNIYNNL